MNIVQVKLKKRYTPDDITDLAGLCIEKKNQWIEDQMTRLLPPHELSESRKGNYLPAKHWIELNNIRIHEQRVIEDKGKSFMVTNILRDKVVLSQFRFEIKA
jgi:hypothetical protein